MPTAAATSAHPATVAAFLAQAARQKPDRLALAIQHRRGMRFTYREHDYATLDRASSEIAAGLDRTGIKRGAHVAQLIPPGFDCFAVMFALLRLGAVPVCIDPGIGVRNMGSCLGEAHPTAMIGVPKAHLAARLLGWARTSIHTRVVCGGRFPGCAPLAAIRRAGAAALADGWQPPPVSGDDRAAILFTSGSTGMPKGVIYHHRTFLAQVDQLRELFAIEPGEHDLPTFPLFALFGPALGMSSIIPAMDFTRPARVDPRVLLHACEQYPVRQMFGSPALLDTVSRFCQRHGYRLPTLRRVLSAGAPVPPRVLKRMAGLVEGATRISTPYGATECLPVATIDHSVVLEETASAYETGHGTCVGHPVPAATVRIIGIDDGVIEHLEDAPSLSEGTIGEICVRAPQVTSGYHHRDQQTALAKIHDADGSLWHRMGDCGYFDQHGRLWFCGRKSQRIRIGEDTLFTDLVEGWVSAVNGVRTAALVQAGTSADPRPCLVFEPEPDRWQHRQALVRTVRDRLAEHSLFSVISQVLARRQLPVDIRHNAKIQREALGRWAAGRLK